MLTGERPPVRVPGIVERTLVKWIALRAPLPWPHGLPTTRDLDQRRGGTSPADFASDLADVIALIERADRIDTTGHAHPAFGPLSHAEWMRWAYLHTDHHLRQFGA
jgi:hypothetical protein